MSRAVAEWIGKTPDTPIPPRVKVRILRRQNHKCGITGAPIPPGVTPDYDHTIALINGGQNRESNIRAVLPDPHKVKSKNDVAEKVKTDAMTIKAFGLASPKQKIPNRPKPEKPAKRFDRTSLPPRPMFKDATR